MDERQQVLVDLKRALRAAIEALVVHPVLQGVPPCVQADQEAPIVGPDGKWVVATVPRRFALCVRHGCQLKRHSDLEETVLAVCEENGVLEILRRREEQVQGLPTVASQSAAQDRADAVQRYHGWGVREFIEEYAERLDAWRFDEDIFDHVYEDYEAVIRDDMCQWEFVVPLWGFVSDVDEVALDDTVSLVRPSASDMASWGPFVWLDPHAFCADLNHHFESGFVLIIRAPSKRWGAPDFLRVYTTICRFVRAIRLLKQPRAPEWTIMLRLRRRFVDAGAAIHGDREKRYGPYAAIDIPPMSQEKMPDLQGSWPRREKVGDGRLSVGFRTVDICRLPREKVPRLHRLWQRLAAEEGRLAVALRRLDFLDERRQVEDKLIDMSILLESTLLAGVKDELRFRLGLRGARLLMPERPPADTNALLKKLYDVRSKVVHGEGELPRRIRVGTEELGADEFAARVQDVCIDILLKLLLDRPPGTALSRFMEELDRQAIEGSTDG